MDVRCENIMDVKMQLFNVQKNLWMYRIDCGCTKYNMDTQMNVRGKNHDECKIQFLDVENIIWMQ